MNKNLNKLEYILAICFTGIICYLLIRALYTSWSFTTDDSYISWHYARNLVEGYGLRWNPDNPPVEGYSNFLWVILSSLVLKLHLPLLISMKWISVGSLLLALYCLYLISRLFLPVLSSLLPIYMFSLYIGVIWWTVSGLETSLFCLFAVFLSLQALRTFGYKYKDNLSISEQDRTRNFFHPWHWFFTCLALTLLSLTRFEGVIWGGILALFIVCHARKKGLRKTQWQQLGLILMMTFLLPYALYFSWRILYFQQLLPNSYLCKLSAPYYRFYLIHDYLVIALPCFILSLPYLLFQPDCRRLLLGLPSLIYCLLLWQADPIIAHFNRLFLPAFSLLCLMTVLGIKEIIHKLYPSAQSFLTLLISLGFCFIFIPSGSQSYLEQEVEHYQQRTNMRLELVNFLNQKMGKNQRILLGDCGIMPFFARKDIKVIDSLCLNNTEFTGEKINSSYRKYAKYLQESVKPEWVVVNYYPRLNEVEALTKVLEKHGFFTQYQLVATFQSHLTKWEKDKLVPGEVDFVYRVYHCLPSYCPST